jgi:hypothetical protein
MLFRASRTEVTVFFSIFSKKLDESYAAARLHTWAILYGISGYEVYTAYSMPYGVEPYRTLILIKTMVYK